MTRISFLFVEMDFPGGRGSSGKIVEFPGGGGEYGQTLWNGKSRGVGGQTGKTLRGGGMDIFWNHTFMNKVTYEMARISEAINVQQL